MKPWKRILAVIGLILVVFVVIYLVFTGKQMVENFEIPTEGTYETTAGVLLDN